MKALPNARFMQGYGMTELSPAPRCCGPATTRTRCTAAPSAAPRRTPRCASSDRTTPKSPRGEVGEIVVRGGNVMLGYWNRPEETAEALRDGWMHTGDVGWMDDEGYVYVIDRIKDMIISGGENVYSVEVENVLAPHPAVATCAVIGVPDETWGERVHAVVVPGPARTADAGRAARRSARERIAGYKAPRSMEFVDALPLSAAGKVLKRELRKPYWAGQERAVH